MLLFGKARIPQRITARACGAAARVLAPALLALALASTSHAQVLYGSLTGNVADQTGAVAVGATVRAINVGTGVEKTTTTNERGVFLFNDLQTVDIARVKVQFRAEALNALNHPNFANPGGDISNAGTFGFITSTTGTGERNLRFGARVWF